MSDWSRLGLEQCRDGKTIHLADKMKAVAGYVLRPLCGCKKRTLRVIDPLHLERFGWDGVGSGRAQCRDCKKELQRRVGR